MSKEEVSITDHSFYLDMKSKILHYMY